MPMINAALLVMLHHQVGADVARVVQLGIVSALDVGCCALLAAVINAVAGLPDQPLVTPREAAARVAVMAAAYQSARTGTRTKPVL